MNHQLAGVLRDFSFCPYEDVLAVGHSEGLTSMLVPGGWVGMESSPSLEA